MNQISRSARPDLRTTENMWSAPASPSLQYDKDGNPAKVVLAFRREVTPVRPAPNTARSAETAMQIPRSSLADYDDGNPGTIVV